MSYRFLKKRLDIAAHCATLNDEWEFSMSKYATGIRFPPEMRERLDKVANEYGLPIARVVKNAVNWWLDQYESAPDEDKPRLLIRSVNRKEELKQKHS